MVKFARNVERDEQSRAALEALGWKVHVVWECQLKKKVVDRTFAELLPELAVELGKTMKPEAVEYYSIALTDASEDEQASGEVEASDENAGDGSESAGTHEKACGASHA